ncbi:MAG TPA: helix-turn-helix domain-containing protein [Gemmatimonadales bacterium]|jgi:AcrR family transcriptional regulator|nr:helix-turn-helix domain-containing protein [Gemmatimonadales bacterium]
MTDTRHRLIEVTARLFAEAGYHGTTTRRIAQEAALNEVTVFRHFGSKDALIREALRVIARERRPMLDTAAPDPLAELNRWALACFTHFYDHRNLIRRMMGEMVERPEIAPGLCEDTNEEFFQLVRFLEALRERGQVRSDVRSEAAAGMLIGALLSNALWRDLLPDMPPPEENVRLYVELLLRAVGADRRLTPRSAGKRQAASR